jgi:hypothetical protein
VSPTSEIVTRLNELIAEARQWGPALPASLIFAVALVEALVLPLRYWAKGAWVLAVVLSGIGAAALLHWDRQATHGAAADRTASETAALHGLWAQWDTLSKSLPAAPEDSPAASFDTLDDALASLSAKVAAIEGQIAALKATPPPAAGRSIDTTTAVRLADYLRRNGSYRVVVSCVPGDLEAYDYANRLVGILKAGGWDAGGPEATVNVVDAAAMGVTILVRDPGAPDAAKILIDAFNQFNIAHQPGIAADYAIPDSATVELFVAKKP